MADLAGKVALVTGGASGIGAAAVEVFVQAGARVVLVDRDGARAEDVAARNGAEALVCDLAAPDSAGSVARSVEACHGRLDILWNNAGIGWQGAFERCTDDDLARVLDIDLVAPWRLTRACLPLLRRTAARQPEVGVSILFTASALALRPRPGCTPYVAAKSALVGLARALAAELGPDGIRVNALCPGLVDTPASRAFTAGWRGQDSDAVFAAYRAESPLGRLAEPRDVAEVAAFLSSDAGRALSAAAVAVDCGTAGR
jgi:NAD(P)-dependent dehydrogenase (short-subunit alcohol dehydrogenase family)